MKILDCRAQKCPHPVVETRKLLRADPGLALTVLVGDEVARENVSRLGRSLGYDVQAEPGEVGYALRLTPAPRPDGVFPGPAVQGKTVAFVTSDAMGAGNDELGRLLLKNFLFTLTELESVPDVVLFVNAGVKLACAGSEALEALEKLACLGADIACCGLCLDFFHLKEKLAIGRVTNMLDIAESLQNAGRIIRP